MSGTECWRPHDLGDVSDIVRGWQGFEGVRAYRVPRSGERGTTFVSVGEPDAIGILTAGPDGHMKVTVMTRGGPIPEGVIVEGQVLVNRAVMVTPEVLMMSFLIVGETGHVYERPSSGNYKRLRTIIGSTVASRSRGRERDAETVGSIRTRGGFHVATDMVVVYNLTHEVVCGRIPVEGLRRFRIEGLTIKVTSSKGEKDYRLSGDMCE